MSYCQFMMRFKCKLQRLFEMSPFRTDTGTKSRTPLIDRVVDDALLQTVPHVNQTLLQIVNVSQLRPINTVLHHTPHLVVHRVEVGVLGGHRLGATKAGASRCSTRMNVCSSLSFIITVDVRRIVSQKQYALLTSHEIFFRKLN